MQAVALQKPRRAEQGAGHPATRRIKVYIYGEVRRRHRHVPRSPATPTCIDSACKHGPEAGYHHAPGSADSAGGMLMTLYSLTYDDMVDVVDTMNRYHRINATIMNKGQLDFALGKPDQSFGGKEFYPELHQKASILMETICKSHCLSDGNKRASMMAAEYLASANGATLVLPLKSIRLTVNCAMDENDDMSDELSLWFKTHIAHNPLQLSIMLEELIEEWHLVTALLRQGKHDEAERLVDAWLVFDNYPANKALWKELLKKWDERRRVLKLGPKTPRFEFFPWLSIGQTLSIDDNVHRALDLPPARIAAPLYTGHDTSGLDKIWSYIQEESSSAGTSRLEQAGRILEHFHSHKDACWVYDKLLEIKGPTEDVLSRQSFNLVFSGQYEKAVATLNQLLGSDPSSPYLNRLKATACNGLGDYTSALESANLVLKQNPDDLQMLKTKVDIVRRSSPRDAQKLDEAIYRLDQDDPTSISNMAALLSDRNMNADAIELFDKVLEKNHQNASALYSKGLCLSRLGNDEEALAYYKKSLQVDPNFVRALINSGMVCAGAGRPTDALAYLKKALKLEPRHPVGLLGMGRVLLALGHVQESIDVLEALHSSDPRNKEGLYWLAAAYARHGKAIHSLGVLESLVNMDPSYKKRLKTDPHFSKLGGLKRFEGL